MPFASSSSSLHRRTPLCRHEARAPSSQGARAKTARVGRRDDQTHRMCRRRGRLRVHHGGAHRGGAGREGQGARGQRPWREGSDAGAGGQGEGGHPEPLSWRMMPVPAAREDDEALVARAAAGEEHAFEQLVYRHQARVYRLACRLTADDGEAKDVLQETFLAAYRGLRAFRGDSRFSTWLYRIATNAALMQRRARGRRPVQSLDAFLPRFDADGVHAAEPADLLAASKADERLDRQILAEKARAGLERLPDIYRDAFVLRDLEELPTAEVAELLGIDAAAVRQRVHRARLLLRGYLGQLAGGKA